VFELTGKIIVIEGLDGTGKKTQAKLLVEKMGAEYLAFPDYESPFGKLVAMHLKGELGSLDEVTPEAASLLYAADRYQKKAEIEAKIREGKTLVIDRYSQASYGHQAGKFGEAEQRVEFVAWLKQMESRLPKADAIVFLDLPVEASAKLREGREAKHEGRDLNEESESHLNDSRTAYLEAAEREGWIVINCSANEGIRSVEDIHAEIMGALSENKVI